MLPLILKMKYFGIHTSSTIITNWLSGSPLNAEKDLKNEGRESSSFRTDANSGIMLLRWYDNKSVQLAWTFTLAGVSGTVKRWDPASKKYIPTPYPEIVKEYNSIHDIIHQLRGYL